MNIMYPDYTNSIINVSHTILDFYHADTRYPVIPELKEKLSENIKHVCLVLLDGMGINIIEKHLNPDTFIRKNLEKKITSIFPPTTVAATNAVLTTNLPYQSGYLGWVQYFKKEDTNLTVFLNEDFYDASRHFQNDFKELYLKQDLIYDYIKKASPKVKTYELFPSFRANGYKSFHLQMKKLLEITRKKEENFSYVYWTQPDMLEHEVGIDDPLIKTTLESLNEELSNFSKQLNDDTILIVIADHGLVNVEPIDLFKNEKLMKYLLRNPSMEPRAANFFVKPFKKYQFKKLFNDMYGKYYQLMTKDKFLYSGLIGQGKKHPLLNSFLGDYIAIATSNKFFSFKEKSSFKAHHAGLCQGEMEVPLIIYKK
jgi:predicted AlkP superfamily pyrophosphatase or phosphodiesterase